MMTEAIIKSIGEKPIIWGTGYNRLHPDLKDFDPIVRSHAVIKVWYLKKDSHVQILFKDLKPVFEGEGLFQISAMRLVDETFEDRSSTR
ncbi:MAG: hypothetical protein GYA55_03045 [SAR324 cluster bacterium]|uniref:Uncharacterized protein n=1 Tax=SAR324 cluster bacterium TaxID=2024889 RepID=A0A7X9FPU6_9DELT|nr:hypothetical protein [SAR324 cluster bacterium]